MTLLLVDKDWLKADVYTNQDNPVDPKGPNPDWDRFNEFGLFVGHTVRSDAYDQGQMKSETKAAADWAVNQRSKPGKSGRDIRVWSFGDEVGSGDITLTEILSVIKNANTSNYYLELIQLITYWEIADPDDEIPTFTVGGKVWYVPNSYNTDEAGAITTQKTWNEWAGRSHAPVEIEGKWYVSSYAGTQGNVPTSGIILYLMDLKNIVINMYTVQEFQALQPPPTNNTVRTNTNKEIK